jgi:hypothetical protein
MAINDQDLRGTVLTALKLQYPEWVLFRVLYRWLTQDWGITIDMSELRLQLAYLAEKGYVETSQITLENVSTKIEKVRCTVKGVDLVDRRTTDPGVSF